MAASVREALRREVIVAGARRLIETDGLDALSLRRVAADLGVTAPALYAHMADKRDLLRAVAESAFADLIAEFREVDATDPIERIRAYSRTYIDYALANPELFRTMFVFPPDLAIGTPTGEELAAATNAFELPAEALSEAIESGALRPVDPLVAALTLWTATHGAADVLLMGFGFDETGRAALIDSVIDTVVAGLSA